MARRVDIKKRHATSKLLIVGIARQHHAAFLVALGDNGHLGRRVAVPKNPLHVARYRKAPQTIIEIVQLEYAEFDGIVAVNENPEFARNAILDMGVDAVAEAMPCLIGRISPARQRRR